LLTGQPIVRRQGLVMRVLAVPKRYIVLSMSSRNDSDVRAELPEAGDTVSRDRDVRLFRVVSTYSRNARPAVRSDVMLKGR
jgi:hypothetical protein